MLTAELRTDDLAGRFRSQWKSPLRGVSDQQWERFVKVLDVQPIRDISESGGFGSYDMRPRRLKELGYVDNLRRVRTSSSRQIYDCDFIKPWTRERFLSDPLAQLKALARSMESYQRELELGEIARPEGASLAGTLVILHRGGRGALRAWPQLFDDTRALYEAARGAF